ncbi:hypothetical protein [Amycolatopsis sp. YIM 10]|uniref:hypothetical protein n=1 Tax=Amycolatopsis sp. YIM 10 TaxID=2653857 RepID=UPI00128FF2EF|nr:hypothetical protein [Amycolatopsis sp. YIM 10]
MQVAESDFTAESAAAGVSVDLTMPASPPKTTPVTVSTAMAPASLTKIFVPAKLLPRSTAIVVRVSRRRPMLAATWLERLRLRWCSWRIEVIAVRWQPRFPHAEGAS